MTLPCRTATICPAAGPDGTRASTSTAGTGTFDPRGADEDRPHRAVVEPGEVEVGLEGIDLTTEGIAAHRHIDAVQRLHIGARVEHLGGEQDHARAGTVGGQAISQPLTQRLQEFEDFQEFADGGGFATGDDQSVDGGQLGFPAHRDRLRPAGLERVQVFSDVTLQGQHTNRRFHVVEHTFGRVCGPAHPGRQGFVRAGARERLRVNTPDVTDVLPHARPETGTETRPRRGLTVATGLAGLSLDAMASVAYGPEAIVLVLAAAGSVGLGYTLPVTLAIVVLLTVLIASYRQVIAAFPNGGGAYAVAKARLGRRTSLVAAASLIVDYVLNVAVSIAAGVAALTSAFPQLFPYTAWICLAVLLGVTVLNLYGIRESARAFMAPTAIFVIGIFVVIIAGLLRAEPASVSTGAAVAENARTIGILLLLKAFSSGCAALTGVEAIANAVPSFSAPKVKRAQRAEVALGVLLGLMLLGLATLIGKFSIHPIEGTTILSQLTEAALGHGIAYYVVQFATVILLALAANTSYGGLPTLTKILADDNCLPHRFAVSSPREVYRYGVLALGVSSAVLLVASRGDMNALVPLFAIGVFVGFTIAQVGMVRHWLLERSPGWGPRAALNGFERC